MRLLQSVAVASIAVSAVNAQDLGSIAQGGLNSVLGTLSGVVGGIIPGGLGTLGALGLPIPSINTGDLSGPLGEVAQVLGPLLGTPIGAAVLGGVLGGNYNPGSYNISLNTLIPAACQQAVQQTLSNRSDCGPLENILTSNSARQSQQAVGDACSPANSGCIAAVQQTVQQNQAVCESNLNLGIPGFNTMNVNYLGVVLEATCVQSNGQYCLPTWDAGISKLAPEGASAYMDTTTFASTCDVGCRNALADTLKNNPNATQFDASSIPNAVNYAQVLDGVCAIDPATGDYCAGVLVGGAGSPQTSSGFNADASKFCTPCARIEMAMGQNFSTSTPKQYDEIVEDIEGYACATDPTTGDLCSELIYAQFNNVTNALSAFNDASLQQLCVGSLIVGQCPAECSVPLQQFIASIGPCGGLLLSNQTISYIQYLPSPINSIVSSVQSLCGLIAVTPPPATASVTATIVLPSGSTSGIETAVVQAVNYPKASVSGNGNTFTITTDSSVSVGQIAQRLTDAIYQGTLLVNGEAANTSSTIAVTESVTSGTGGTSSTKVASPASTLSSTAAMGVASLVAAGAMLL